MAECLVTDISFQRLQWSGITVSQIAPMPSPTIGVELMIGWRGMDLSAAKQDFDSLRAHDTRAELYGRGRGWPALAGKIDPRGIDHVSAMEALGCQADCEIHILPFFGKTFETKVILETHPSRHENQIARSKADWRCGDPRNAKFGTTLEDLPAN